MNRCDLWIQQRMLRTARPRCDNIDHLSECFSHDMKQEIPRAYESIQNIQIQLAMNVPFYIASVMYFADDCDWKKKS